MCSVCTGLCFALPPLVQFLVVLYIASYITPMLTVLTSLYLGTSKHHPLLAGPFMYEVLSVGQEGTVFKRRLLQSV